MITYEIINLSAGVASLFIIVMLIAGVLFGGNLREKTTRWFFITLLMVFLGSVNEALLGLPQHIPGYSWNMGLGVAEFLSYALWGLQGIALSKYLYEYLSTKTKVSSKPFYLAYFFGAATVVLAVVAQANQLYGSFDSQYVYQQHDTFWISTVCPNLMLLIYAAVVLRYRKALKVREWGSLLFYVVVLVACYVLSGLVPELWVAYAGAAISMFVIYINIQVELKQQLTQQQVQLEESRRALMLSQIQPHFLYNSLTAISGQCKNSPEAQRSIVLFSQYLRGNMESLSQKVPVPFEDELAHTKQYVSLEKLRFGDRLQVEYEIKATDFMLPVLSLQPLVENAVRHGIMKKKEGGTVIVRTEEGEHSFFITVQDDGVGFDPFAPAADDRSHVGIENVRDRLAALSGGTLTIKSIKGSGTSATLEIPKVG